MYQSMFKDCKLENVQFVDCTLEYAEFNAVKTTLSTVKIVMVKVNAVYIDGLTSMQILKMRQKTPCL